MAVLRRLHVAGSSRRGTGPARRGLPGIAGLTWPGIACIGLGTGAKELRIASVDLVPPRIRYNPTVRRLLALPMAVRRRVLSDKWRPFELILDRLAERVVGDIHLSAPEFSGEFSLPATSDLFKRLIASGQYEDEIRGLFLSAVQPDRDVIDVGANVGFFTVLAGSRLCRGRVLAIEPGKAAFVRLQGNVERNRVQERVIIFKGMAGSENGEAVLHVVPGKEEYSSSRPIVHASAQGHSVVPEAVPVRTLDDLVNEHGLSPSIIKVDVEGAEADVFEGAREVLRRHRPKIVCEFSRTLLGARAERVLQILEECDYRVVDAAFPDVPPGRRDPCDIWCEPRSP